MSARPNAQLRRQQVLAERAAEMRATPTRSEQALWEMLRAGKLGAPVRRQVVLGQHVVDFLVPACRLVIEVDGGYHRDRRVADARRERALRRLGYRVLRLSSCPNSQVLLAPLRVSRSASLRARARLRSSPSSGFARAGKTSRSEPGVSSLSHARLVVPRPGAVVGLRSTGARSAPRRAVTGSRVPITMALAREEALRAARHRSCALGREARPPRRASLPAPTRRRCAASVFPKLGLRPSGEDGLRRERARGPGWRSPPDFATSPPAGERILRGFAALPRGTGLAHARMAWAIPHTRLHCPSDRVPAIDRRAPCSTRRWRSTGRRSWRGPKSTAACRASPRRVSPVGDFQGSSRSASW